MNIFVLDADKQKCVEYYCDKHIVKMISEYCQLLSNAIYTSTGSIVQVKDEGKFKIMYPKCTPTIKPTHINHPCSIWVRQSRQNFDWLCDVLELLHSEWQYRYNHNRDKLHASYYKFKDGYVEPNLQSTGLTQHVQSIKDYPNMPDPIKAYRNYYNGDKRHLFHWTKREIPYWITAIEAHNS